ncbi:WYL domain-containing protein [Teredinibacter turnerae]|uniref:WYL domain-containing protein n=1 Tax=Teredinibacter turnerae TaxID=2426 RepID=UPI00039C1E69|nr:WYL domain-containing protein [Teredinibacter turnerae]
MSTPPLNDISQAQKERLRFIDFRLYFLATLNRNDLISRFGIKEAAATRDIAAYRELRPDNAEYDSNAKSYLKQGGFQPLFEYSSRDALATLASGIGDDSVVEQRAIMPCETPTTLTNPDVDVVAGMANAISLGKAVKMHYYSLSSGDTEREFVPFTFVNNGLRWHVRGYDRLKKRFGDFVLTRIDSAQVIRGAPDEHEKRLADNQWNRIVELCIVPHPSLENPKGVEMDYAMEDGILKVNLRAAVAGYLLRLWNVDCSVDHSINDAASHLWLKNTLALYGVDNLKIAPGYKEVNS